MLKTGIYDLYQIRSGSRFKGFFGGDKRLSITLYDRIADCPDSDALAERILLHFSDSRGAYKRTFAKRFETFDRDALVCIEKEFGNRKDLTVFDVGVSDGRTSCDFFTLLASRFRGISFFATDYDAAVTVIEKGRTKVVLGTSGQILEVVWPPFVFNMTQPESLLYYPINHLIRFFIEPLAARPLVKAYKTGQITARTIFLFSPEAVVISRADKRFHLGQHDILMPFDGSADVIRAMNVLNPSYFLPAEMESILSHIYKALPEGGLFITGSNQEAGSTVHGGIYRRTGVGFTLVTQSGDGSPVKEGIGRFTLQPTYPS